MIDDFSATSLGKGLRNMVHKDAVITTDGWSGYQPVAKDFWHEVFLSNKGDNFKLLHWHIFNLKNWIRGVHHKISGRTYNHTLTNITLDLIAEIISRATLI
jgi:hypothetical protein